MHDLDNIVGVRKSDTTIVVGRIVDGKFLTKPSPILRRVSTANKRRLRIPDVPAVDGIAVASINQSSACRLSARLGFL
jgi:hypothetical protein